MLSIILAFHAHEPLWDLPRQVLASMRDVELRREAVPNDDWVRKRADAGRDIYAQLLALGRRLDAQLSLEATNEVLVQVRRHMPDTFSRLGEAYRSGALYPIYGNAFHTHIAMLTNDELADELRLNREFLRDVLRAPEPRHPGAFPMEGSVDASRLEGYRRAGMEYVIFPNLSPRTARYRFDTLPDETQEVYTAFTIANGLLALPRHFPISQEIWRPITKWQPQRLVPQGYILGKYTVLDEEYRDGRTAEHPITREQAIDEYCATLRRSLTAAPDGRLLLYIQDLELMDFGEEALDILGEAWTRVRAERSDVRFVTPDTYIDELRARGERLPHLRFHQVSWAPEIRLVLRSDGHYPPLDAGAHSGIDNDIEVFRRWPFIFWEPGRFIADTFKPLLAAFGHALEIPLSGADLGERIDDFAALGDGAKLALHMRVMQRACNFGWQPDEARHKWPYMHGAAICEILRDELKRPETAAAAARAFSPLPRRALRGLDRVLEIFIDTRVAYLRRGIARLGARAGSDERRAEAAQHLLNAEHRRVRASALIRQAQAQNAKLDAAYPASGRPIQRLLALLQEHCRETYLALNEIQRAWMCIEDSGAMIEEMYDYLYGVYPPLFPSILRDLASPEELAKVDDPELL